MKDKRKLEEILIVGTKIKIGPKFAKHGGYYKGGEVIELVEGFFECDNGLYSETQTAPSIWDEQRKEFDSIYHLFGNDLEDFMDCKIIPALK